MNYFWVSKKTNCEIQVNFFVCFSRSLIIQLKLNLESVKSVYDENMLTTLTNTDSH